MKVNKCPDEFCAEDLVEGYSSFSSLFVIPTDFKYCYLREVQADPIQPGEDLAAQANNNIRKKSWPGFGTMDQTLFCLFSSVTTSHRTLPLNN